MPETEMKRREVTGTLHTGSVMAHAISTLAKESSTKLAKVCSLSLHPICIITP